MSDILASVHYSAAYIINNGSLVEPLNNLGLMDIPVEALSTEALEGVIKEFVLREGTDYGHADYTLESKVERVKQQLSSGHAKIVFDPENETFDIIRNT